MAKHSGGNYEKGFGILVAFWAIRYLIIPVFVPSATPSEVYIMVSSIPADFVVYDAVVAAVVAVVVCVFTFLWRYVEHNDAEALDRESNPMKLKFIGGTALAAVVSAILAYLASSVLVGYFGIVEPVAADYCIFAAIAALIFGIAFTIIFSEGITAFGKFLSQKVKEVKKVAEELSPEMQAALAEFLAAKKAAEVPAEEVPKE